MIPGWSMYEVSMLGRVRSWAPWRGTRTPHVLAGGLDRDGYRKVTLVRPSARQTFRVAVLVAGAFLPARPPGMLLTHLKRRTDDRAASLGWHPRRVAARSAGVQRAKLKPHNVRRIYLDRRTPPAKLAARFRVHKSTIYAVQTGRTWGWLTQTIGGTTR